MGIFTWIIHPTLHGDLKRAERMNSRDNEKRLDHATDVPPPQPAPAGDPDTLPALTSDKLVFDPAAEPAPPQHGSLLGSDPSGVLERWHVLQALFVDDPREAVQRADLLIEEVMTAIRETLERRLGELREPWKNTDRDDTETERLRMALRAYRNVLHKLMPLADDHATR
ncbi:hypothetical protein [Nonomuraea diastatica]|uniref:Uncharacterized protein n=1 Tax=Nonomuraea diastatica TaxID=1848329 RepID=A0A4R4WP38_9ACTN|nr:hypothetical protein [Nonomuraea diastatica]TDD18904.1 hypothetical protein E1294_22520 [Nonomuraea diastatica]